MGITIGPCGCGVLCGPEWHSSNSILILKPEASRCQLPCLRHGVSPAEGKPRESGSQLPASSRQNCISASPGFPQSLQSEHIQLPRRREGQRDTEQKISLAGKHLASSCHSSCRSGRLILILWRLQKSLKWTLGQKVCQEERLVGKPKVWVQGAGMRGSLRREEGHWCPVMLFSGCHSFCGTSGLSSKRWKQSFPGNWSRVR